ncbi:hypothetical protein CVS27_13070 [Arthrobacter glacialis]|uniref:Gram-positive cocci surface proteins LPxTG domain-containing protein n=2 Tax=Arthrobacter glacialis TaxID=1664 RepID=A0A2S3ZVG9_ARTGL|nr:hypothetical protein CVS27_13070 [Arthrobacter glacialis]
MPRRFTMGENTLKKLWQTILGGSAVTAIALVGMLPAQAAPGDVAVPDSNLRSCMNVALGQAPDAVITETQAGSFTGVLSCATRGITLLTGLEAFTSVNEVDLRGNNFQDLSALAGLTELTVLQLSENDIVNISALAGLGKLQTLGLNYNNVVDIAAVAGMPNLADLGLFGNNVVSVEPLKLLTSLKHVDLYENDVADVSDLSGLANLTFLRLSNNKVTDISGLAGLANVEDLLLSENSITDISPLSGLTNLEGLFLSGNHVANVAPLASLSNLETLDIVDQMAVLPAIYVGANQESPIKSTDGTTIIPVSTTAQVNAQTGAWRFPQAGSNELTWAVNVGIAGKQFSFAGTIQQQSLPSGLVVTAPQDKSIAAGADTSFSSTATSAVGTNSVVWESSTDDGDTWVVVPGATTAVLSIADAGVERTGTLYRATYTNSADGAVVSSLPARLTVTAPTVEPTVDPTLPSTTIPSTTSAAPSTTATAAAAPLATTGANSPLMVAGGSLVLLALGMVLLSARRRTNNRTH